jgi:hypothetical protein
LITWTVFGDEYRYIHTHTHTLSLSLSLSQNSVIYTNLNILLQILNKFLLTVGCARLQIQISYW